MEGVRALDALLRGSIRGKRVFVRADLNVPLRGGSIRDDRRIRAALRTLERLADAGARVIVASHLGRPGGHGVRDLSLAPVADCLEELLGVPVHFSQSWDASEVAARVAALIDGEVLLLENLRFEPGETANDPIFAERLARLADVYVLDAFATAHRAHASTVGVQDFVEERVAGELVEWEVRHLEPLLEPEQPFVCLLGGSKVSTKAHLLEAIAERADTLAIGGAMAFPFMLAKGRSVGASKLEGDVGDIVTRVLSMADRSGCQLLLPTDHSVAARPGSRETTVSKEIPAGASAVDIGPETAARYSRAMSDARSIFWNGPMGIFELPGCDRGTRKCAEALARSGAYTVVGGGETVAALREFGLEDAPRHVSTGGGAALEYIAGGELPAIAALSA